MELNLFTLKERKPVRGDAGLSQNMFHPRLYFVCLSSVSGSSRLLFNHWYCMIAGFILVIMVLAVCVTHWKARVKEKKKKIRHPNQMLTSPVNI